MVHYRCELEGQAWSFKDDSKLWFTYHEILYRYPNEGNLVLESQCQEDQIVPDGPDLITFVACETFPRCTI